MENIDQSQFARQMTLEQTYYTETGVEAGVTVTAGFQGLFWTGSVEFSLAVSWKESFSSTTSTSDTYTFNLNPGTSCVPTMIHVDLDCDVLTQLYVSRVTHLSPSKNY